VLEMNMGQGYISGSRDPVPQSVKKCNEQREHVSVIHAEPVVLTAVMSYNANDYHFCVMTVIHSLPNLVFLLPSQLFCISISLISTNVTLGNCEYKDSHVQMLYSSFFTRNTTLPYIVCYIHFRC